jgi:hypothetical protein
MARERSDSTPARNRGSSPVGGAAPQRSRGKLLGLILAAVVVLVLLALLLSRCGSDDDSSSGSSTSPTSSTGATTSSSSSGTGSGTSSSATPSTAVTPAGAPGTVTAGSQSLLEAAGSADPATALAALTGQPVTATAVQVLSVPADEGFWVGTSDTARVWVQLTGGGESGYQVVEGDTVDFTGTLLPHDDTFASTVGVDDAEGAAQLTAQAQHVEVAKDAVTLTS